MKTLFRILIILAVLLITFFYSSINNRYEPLEGPNTTTQIVPKTEIEETNDIQESLPRPEKGLSTWIGEKSNKLIQHYGEPDRYDPSTYGYEWWIYNDIYQYFIMFAVDNGVITQVYTNGQQSDVAPYQIGQSLQEIYQQTVVDTEVTVSIDDNHYTFIMSEDDMNTRIIVKLGNIYAQLYMDSKEGTLSGVRFLNGETLALHRPYETSFVGELISPPSPNSYLIDDSNQASASQLLDLLNVFRLNQDVANTINDHALTSIAKEHSEEMYKENYLSHESPTKGDLKDRLEREGISYKKADENIATAYIDSIEAVHGWLNSKSHREIMLNEEYTYVGSGVFMNFYTQVFIEKSEE